MELYTLRYAKLEANMASPATLNQAMFSRESAMGTPPLSVTGPTSFPPAGVEIRPAETRDEFLACVDLQRETWGRDFSDVVPLSMLQITSKMKGVVTGAFGPDGTLYGFVYGVTGIRGGELAHWSHMLAVRPEARDQGIGRRLKLAQKEELRVAGVKTMYWTYDPLVARNAHFNLNLLGATVDDFVENMYGESDSELHQLGTDRFIVKWDLMGREGTAPPAPAGASEDRPVTWTAGEHQPVPPPDADVIEVLIPRNIEAVEARCFKEALAWRHSTRRVFARFLNGSHQVTAFVPGDTHGTYTVSRPHSIGGEASP